MTQDDFARDPLAHVEARAAGDHWTLVFERELGHPPEKVWAALTQPGQLQEWSPFTTNRDLGTPGDATLTMIDGGEPVDLPAVVQQAEQPKLLEYTWGDDVLRWELEPTSTGTRLTLSHTVAERTMVPKMAAGWHICLAVADRFMAGSPVGPIVGEAAYDHGWRELYEGYARALGIDPADG